MMGEGHSDYAHHRYHHGCKATTIACPTDPPDHERCEGNREVTVGEARGPEEKHGVGHVDEAGERCSPARMRDALEDEVEASAHNDTRNTHDQHARGEGAQSGDLYHSRGECTQSRVVS